MRKITLTICILMVWGGIKVSAQDPQFSQFYAAPLYLNPAFAGSTGQTRAGINYRNQWPSISASFVTYNAYIDHHFVDYRASAGLLISNDTEGLAGLNSTSAAAQFSYQIPLMEGLVFTPGIQAGYFYRNLNFTRLTFGDQFDPNTGQPLNQSTAENFNTGFSKGFFDISTGGLLYTKTMWLGVAWHHMNRPVQSFIDPTDRLPAKISVHGGLRIPIGSSGPIDPWDRSNEKSITPSFQYRHQGEFDQLDLGTYLTLEPIVFGLWYRGIPFKTLNGVMNNESIIFMVGMTKRGKEDALNIGYSYDFTISGLGAGTGGAHEFSLSYTWSMRDPRKPDRDKMYLPCPDPRF